MTGAVGHAAGRVCSQGSVHMPSVLNRYSIAERLQVPAFALKVLQSLAQHQRGLCCSGVKTMVRSITSAA